MFLVRGLNNGYLKQARERERKREGDVTAACCLHQTTIKDTASSIISPPPIGSDLGLRRV